MPTVNSPLNFYTLPVLDNKKLVGIYSGKAFFFENAVELNSSVADPSKLNGMGFWEFPRLNVIKDHTHDVFLIIGDYPGNDEFYPGALRIFIYKDKAVRGKFNWLRESDWDNNVIQANIEIQPENKLFVYGDWIVPGSVATTENFILVLTPIVNSDLGPLVEYLGK